MDELHRWFRTQLGQAVVDAECRFLSHRLTGIHARTILQIGSFGQGQRPALFGNARQWLVDHDADGPLDVAGDCRELPFASDSMDVVLLVHQLEFTPAPHDVLREVARIVSPEGWLINLGFNPYSFWGLRRALARNVTDSPWRGRYVSRARVEDWLRVLGLAIEHRDGLMLRPPLRNRRQLERLAPLERWGRHYARWLGGVHVTAARKHVAGVTPLSTVERPRLEVVPGGLAQARVRPAARRRNITTERD
jgi:SAM-dependent methyltransferase